ncbi:hypothetical protein [Desulfolucanica intricata]|uniref:hypothetical protein n=1 Tax=Desulfolucanica intricata TaxID=1285191 RepID=UPI000A71DE7B|nr:hypothetical protein [Desulfolucanica intricata]
MSATKKEERKGFLGMFKKPKKDCCDMEIVEVKDKPKKSHGCCDMKIIPAEEDKK